MFLKLHLLAFSLGAFVVKAVYGRYDVAVFRIAIFVGQFIIGIARDGDDMRRVVEVYRLFGFETVDYEVGGKFGICFVLFGFPVEKVAIGCPFRLEAADLFRGAVVHVDVGRDESGVTMVMPLEAICHACSIAIR